MTVIAWDGKTLAADKMMSLAGYHSTVTKVHRLSDGRLVAGCGSSTLIAEMRAWLGAGCDPATFPAAQRVEKDCAPMVVVQPDGVVLLYEVTPYPVVVQSKHFAMGSGRDFAAMAMHLGKTACEAVLLTAQLCHDCGNGVDAMELMP